MGFEPYGGYIYSDEKAVATNPLQDQLMTVGLAGGVGIASLIAGSRSGSNDYNVVDTFYQGAKFLANQTPFGLGNTFRVDSFLSPFISPASQGMDDQAPLLSAGKYGKTFSRHQLESNSTRAYLKKAFGLSDDALANAGILPGMIGSDDLVAESLVFERDAKSPSGNLYTVVNGQRRELASGVSLMRLTQDSVEPMDDVLLKASKTKAKYSKKNLKYTSSQGRKKLRYEKPADKHRAGRAAFSVMSALDMFAEDGFSANAVFEGQSWFPIPGAIDNSHGSFNQRTAYARSIPAFEIERFSRLASGFVYQTFGKEGKEAFEKITGLGIQGLPGTASSQFLRIGGRVALAGAAIGGVAQADWVRRKFEEPGHFAVSAGMSGAIGYGLTRLGVRKQVAGMGAVASFFGQQVLPGFDQGLVPGIASTYARTHELLASDFNIASQQKRLINTYLPGAADPTTGALLGIAGMAAIGLRLPYINETASDYLNGKLLQKNVKGHESFIKRKSVSDIFWHNTYLDKSLNADYANYAQTDSTYHRARNIFKILSPSNAKAHGGYAKLFSTLNENWDMARDLHGQLETNHRNDELLINRLRQINVQSNKTTFSGRVTREVKGAAAQLYYSFFGADSTSPSINNEIRSMGFGNIPLPDIDLNKYGLPLQMPKSLPFSPVGRLGRFATVGLGIFGLHALATGSVLGSIKSSEELNDIYSGKTKVEIKKSRWWEAGGTPFEGGATSYYRPHAISLMLNRVREKGIWGENEDDISPLGKFYKKNFTYDLEKLNYDTRPYPITSAAFSDVPIIGGLLSSTIGRLIKPPKLMHVDEWVNTDPSGNMSYASVGEGWRTNPAYELGAKDPGVPVSPFHGGQLAAEGYQQFNELAGMTGWARNLLVGTLTGSAQFNTDNPVLADAGAMTSMSNRFLETQQGGLLFSNEMIRRIFPSYRSEVTKTNPISNSMPSWLPDRFGYGDPYRLIEWGEARLPGAGYAQMNPELKGMDPEHYPLIHRYKILADVAPFSENFRRVRNAIYEERSIGKTNKQMNALIDKIDKEVSKKYNILSFDEETRSLPGSKFTSTIWRSLKQTLRDIVAPVEYLVPMGFRPVQKLMGDDRNPIDKYEYERMYGTPLAFWEKPWRDWFRPALYSTAHAIGMEGKPKWRQEADALNQQFDQLEFIKWMRLAEMAGQSPEAGSSKNHYLRLAANTRYGVNPKGDPMGIYWSLPDEDRAYFNSFLQAKGSARDRILEMVPQDQVHLYKATWDKIDAEGGVLKPVLKDKIDEEYLYARYSQIEQEYAGPMPRADWIGFNENVDMSDIKVKYIDSLGKDLHDYGLWEKEIKKVNAQPFLEDSTNFMYSSIDRASINSVLHESTRGDFSTTHSGGARTHTKLIFNDNRSSEIQNGLRDYYNER